MKKTGANQISSGLFHGILLSVPRAIEGKIIFYKPVRQEKLKRQRFRDVRKPSYRHHLSAGQGKIQYDHYAQYNRYQPKALKSCFLIKPIRNRMASMETIKGNHHAYQQNTQLRPEKPPPSTRKIRIFTPLAPSIAGIARKKGKLSGYKTGAAKEHSAEDSSARPGGAGNQRQHIRRSAKAIW